MISLKELNTYIKQVIALNFEQLIALKAEIHQANEARGHWYIELIEKDEHSDEIIARQSAVMWRSTAAMLFRKYGSVLGDLLEHGNEVSLKCTVDYHIKYGLKLMIQDIDPSFTLGQLEITRQQTLEYIKKHGLVGRNKLLPRPLYYSKIAVISSRTAAGFADFTEHLIENEAGLGFNIHLYHASVQGSSAVPEILDRLRMIERSTNTYDCVCILRGGGSRLDLSAFDDKMLAIAIAEYPLPVFTGIGHETDLSVADMVAGESLKTPTALATYIIRENYRHINHLDAMSEQIASSAREVAAKSRLFLNETIQEIYWRSSSLLSKQRRSISKVRSEIRFYVKNRIERSRLYIQSTTHSIQDLRPDSVLQRGFAIVSSGESKKVIQRAKAVNRGMEIEIRWEDGTAKGKIN